jgi:uncharacterized DUF497 family protein
MNGGPEFDWDQDNVEHIARHNVTPAEAEQVLRNKAIIVASQIRNGEERVLCVGRTDARRAIQLIYTIRQGRFRVVTAHDASRRMRRFLYEAEEAGN